MKIKVSESCGALIHVGVGGDTTCANKKPCKTHGDKAEQMKENCGAHCLCEPQTPEAEWIKEFDKRFPDVFDLVFQKGELKDFIRQLLAEQAKEIEERCERDKDWVVHDAMSRLE